MALAAAGTGVAAGDDSGTARQSEAGPWVTLGWGSGDGQAGYLNHTVEGFQEMAALGPQAILRRPDGTVVLADTFNHRLLVFEAGGALRRTVTAPGMRLPWLLAEAPGGALLVALGELQRIVRFGRDWKFEGLVGSGDSEFRQLAGLAADGAGRIFAADLALGEIHMLSGEKTRPATFEWDGGGMLATPDGALLDLVFVEEVGHAVRERRPDGRESVRFEIAGTELTGGSLLGLDGEGRTYVRFANPDRPGVMHVLRFGPAGAPPIQVLELPLLPADQGVRVLEDGRLLWLEHDATRAPSGQVRIWMR